VPVRTIRLTLEYDGTRFVGWQRQARGRTVQAEVERAVAALAQAPTPVVGAGRTDAGVHALGQVAHFRTDCRLAADKIAGALNALLPPDVSVPEAAEAPASFHARRDARFRVYRYVILRRLRPSAFLRPYTLYVPGPLDDAAMRAGLALLAGAHDFRAFCALSAPTRTTACTLALADLSTRDDLLILTFGADRFLRHMVRMMVGTLLRIGQGSLSPDIIGRLMTAGRDGSGGPAAPAHGLYLVHVGY
jgi:tRNA pseudouridine38-40 synthase